MASACPDMHLSLVHLAGSGSQQGVQSAGLVHVQLRWLHCTAVQGSYGLLAAVAQLGSQGSDARVEDW